MGKSLYTAEAHVSGGRDEGRASTKSGTFDVGIRIPAQLGGDGSGTNPEELFAMGYGACFENAVRTVSRRKKVEPGQTSVDSKVTLVAAEDRSFNVAVELHVNLPDLDDEQALEIVRSAHKTCPYSNATRGNIDVTMTAKGRPVG
jgi:lipoyl-dependent peroxiredoxin